MQEDERENEPGRKGTREKGSERWQAGVRCSLIKLTKTHVVQSGQAGGCRLSEARERKEKLDHAETVTRLRARVITDIHIGVRKPATLQGQAHRSSSVPLAARETDGVRFSH